jgi:hypothetical protein
MKEAKQPPPGVETTPQGPVVSLQEAAAWLGKDRRTLMRAIKAGQIRGGAIPRPERLRWYVYADELPLDASADSPTPPPPAASPPVARDTYVEDLRAENVSLREANRLLIAAQGDLLDADQASHSAADKYRSAARRYLDALAQFMTPGHLGELAQDL